MECWISPFVILRKLNRGGPVIAVLHLIAYITWVGMSEYLLQSLNNYEFYRLALN